MADGIKFRFDFSLVHEGNLRNRDGLTPQQMGQAIKRAEREAKKLALRHAAGEIGFPGLPFREKEARAVSRYAARMRKRFTHMLVLGIGGSALGTKAVYEGVGGEGARKGLSLSVADNVDPDEFFPLLRSHPMKTTAVVAISKSGGTAETNAQLALAIESLKQACGKKWKDHLVMITDPEKGVFRRFADSLGVATFPVPQNVGGRFSVLSPVGLLPLAAAGVSTEKLLSGARWMESVFRRGKGRKNPVLSAAAIYSHYLVENPKPVQVWFTYGEGLARVAEWWQQLWGESLGKRRGTEPPVGQTPTRAVGVTDQHSQVQLFQDGPADKIFTFVKWMSGREKGNVPASGFAPGMEILGKRPLRDLFDAEFEGTIGALWKAGRPIVRIEVGKRDEAHLGALLHFWEWVTAIAGECAGIDPFDQPGVEEGKIITRALMGEKGAAKQREEFLRAKRNRVSYEIRLSGRTHGDKNPRGGARGSRAGKR
ncbi:MAG: glucose-6-phosphate isomerase [Deltaproteobacteria bacterium]|nr:glucose-6-phosphate isomerase [Deltaproteobacteria bacterium]